MFGTLYHTHSSLLLIFKCSGKRDSIQVSLTTRQVINTLFISVTAGMMGGGGRAGVQARGGLSEAGRWVSGVELGLAVSHRQLALLLKTGSCSVQLRLT